MHKSILYVLAALLVAAAALPGTADAQERKKEKKIVVEIVDGKTIVNGEEVEADDEGRIVITRIGDDGEEEEIVIRSLGGDDGPLMLFSEEDGDFTVRRGDGGEGRVWFSGDGVGEHDLNVFFDEDGEHKSWSFSEGDAVREYMLQNRPRMLREHADARRLMEESMDARTRLRGRTMPDQTLEIMRDGLAGNAYFEAVTPFATMDLMHTDEAGAELREELRNLEREIRTIARDARRAMDAERTELEANLDEMLAKALELKQSMHQLEIEHMEKRLEELRERFELRESDRREVLERRKRELLGRRDPLDW